MLEQDITKNTDNAVQPAGEDSTAKHRDDKLQQLNRWGGDDNTTGRGQTAQLNMVRGGERRGELQAEHGLSGNIAEHLGSSNTAEHGELR